MTPDNRVDRLEVGSFAMLKSGGPVMTVMADSAAGSDRVIRAGWFSQDGTYHEAKFPHAALQVVTDAQLRATQVRLLKAAGVATAEGDPLD